MRLGCRCTWYRAVARAAALKAPDTHGPSIPSCRRSRSLGLYMRRLAARRRRTCSAPAAGIGARPPPTSPPRTSRSHRWRLGLRCSRSSQSTGRRHLLCAAHTLGCPRSSRSRWPRSDSC
eukprot:5825468-Prymnesium_polylepis.2